MSGKEKLDRLRKSDKVMPDTHREFLDMDTDEEDVGRQESTEVEVESQPEPERPVYKTEELSILVEYIKELLVLPAIEESYWNESCHEVIREYFCNPVHDILTIFYEKDTLTAALEIPKNIASGFGYFLRPHWHIFTKENFRSTVSYGTINENVDKSVLKFMENVCAPIVLNYQSWPQIIQNELFSSFNLFLMRFMELIYKSEGLAMLYVPRERSISDETIDCPLQKIGRITEELEVQEEFSARLEIVVYHWIRQIRLAIRAIPIRNNIKNLLDEVNFWTAKSSNLNNLQSQLLSTDVQRIIRILLYFRSPTVELLDELMSALKNGIKEASSNSSNLQILAEHSEKINVLGDSDASIAKCMLVILFIWTECPYYNKTSNIETLCVSFGTQIINECISHIDLNNTFDKNPEEGILVLEKCIGCCIAYQSLYSKLTKEVASRVNPGNEWNARENIIFNNIRTFTQRCRDVIDICNALVLYGRFNKTGLLGTPKHTEYEVYCRKMKTIFNDSLSDIKHVRARIFDVTDANWINEIGKFKMNIKQLENMIKNLIITMFSRVKNVEEGIETLYAFLTYKNVNFVQDLLQKKWTEVWEIFHKEIEFCYAMSHEKRNKELSCILSLSQYLEKQHDTMIKASYFLGNSAAETCILQEYKQVIKTLQSRRDKRISN